MTPVDIDVELRGEIALATVLMEVGWPDAARAGAFRFTDVWVRDAAGWRVNSRSASAAERQNSDSCPPTGTGGRKRVTSSGGSARSRPRRARASLKRRAMRSASTPAPVIRLPQSGS